MERKGISTRTWVILYSIVFTIFIVYLVICELRGTLRDAGIFLGLIGILLTVGLGVQASTKSNVERIEKVLGQHTAILKDIRDLLKRK